MAMLHHAIEAWWLGCLESGAFLVSAKPHSAHLTAVLCTRRLPEDRHALLQHRPPGIHARIQRRVRRSQHPVRPTRRWATPTPRHAPVVIPGVQGRWQTAKSCAHLPSCAGTTYEVRQGCRRTLHQTSLLFAEREPESPRTQESRAPTAPAVLRRGARRRGGSAKGRGWWEAGRRIRKQNSYDDFAACADYLIDGGITSPNGLAIVVRALTLPTLPNRCPTGRAEPSAALPCSPIAVSALLSARRTPRLWQHPRACAAKGRLI